MMILVGVVGRKSKSFLKIVMIVIVVRYYGMLMGWCGCWWCRVCFIERKDGYR